MKHHEYGIFGYETEEEARCKRDEVAKCLEGRVASTRVEKVMHHMTGVEKWLWYILEVEDD